MVWLVVNGGGQRVTDTRLLSCSQLTISIWCVSLSFSVDRRAYKLPKLCYVGSPGMILL